MSTEVGSAKQTQFRPFHETIVEAIKRCPGPPQDEMERLLRLIRDTKIPKGQDEIIAAIDEFFNNGGLRWWVPQILREAKESVLVQKQVTEAEGERKRRQTINLAELQQEVEKLLALLKERNEAGMGIAWSGFMDERLQNLHRLTSQALGK